MERDYKLFIQDIKESIEIIKKYVAGMSEDDFKKDMQVQDAVIRRLEIIGEAARKIPRAVKQKNDEIAWEDIINYRDFIVHSYFLASLKRVWNVISELDDLKNKIDKIRLL